MSEKEQSPLLDDDTHRESTSADGKLSLTYKLIKTCVLFCLFFTESSFVEVIGPILPELVVQTSSSYEDVMRSISMRGVGFVAGGIIGGVTVDRYFEHIDMTLACITSLYSVVGLGIGYVTNIHILFVMFVLQGLLEQWFQTAGIRMTLKLWKQSSSVGLYAMYVGSSVAYIITPKVAGLFLDPRFSGRSSQLVRNSTCDVSTNINSTVQAGISDWDNPLAKYPADFIYVLWIFAALGQLVAFVFLGFYIHKNYSALKYDDKAVSERGQDATTIQKLTDSLAPSTCSPTKPTLGLIILAAVFLYVGATVPVVRIFPKMIFSYARDEACLTVDRATTLQSTYFIMMAVGRIISLVLSPFVHSKYIMQVSGVGILISATALYIRADNSIVLWVGIAAKGLFVASIVPGLFAVLNSYIEMTSIAILFPKIGGAIGDVLVMFFLGPDYETVGPSVLWIYFLILTVIQCLAIVILQVLCHIHGERNQTDDQPSGK